MTNAETKKEELRLATALEREVGKSKAKGLSDDCVHGVVRGFVADLGGE